jgi:hypothetical protein
MTDEVESFEYLQKVLGQHLQCSELQMGSSCLHIKYMQDMMNCERDVFVMCVLRTSEISANISKRINNVDEIPSPIGGHNAHHYDTHHSLPIFGL